MARTGQEGVRRVIERGPDVVLLDLRLPDLSGLDVYRRIRQIDARIPVVFITAAPTAHYAIEAMKEGAYDYLIKPLDTQHLRRVVGQVLELSLLIREPAVVAESPPEEERGDAIIGCCPSMLEVFKAIGRVAAQDVTVLITGESGTGKELVARAVYQHGARAKEPFLAINFAAIPENLLESDPSATRRGPSPAPSGGGSASSSSAPAGRCSSTRSATCRWRRRARSSACCRIKPSSGSAATRRSRPTCD